MKPLYIFIDESGTDQSSDFFVLTIALTQNPDSIRHKISYLINKVKRVPTYKSSYKPLSYVRYLETKDCHLLE